jgi:WD40 repeat protein
VFDVKGEREAYALPNEHGAVWCVAWSRNGKTLAAGTEDGMICLVDGIPDAPRVRTIQAHAPTHFGSAKLIGVRSLAWSPTDDRLASCGADRRFKVWDAVEGAELVRMRSNAYVLRIAWSPDGTQLASGDIDRKVILWDANSGTAVHTMTGHGDWVDSVAWSPDGKRIASAGLDNSVRIWDPATGQETFALRGEAGFFHDVSWNRDGSRIAAACSDGRVWMWDASKGYELEKGK